MRIGIQLGPLRAGRIGGTETYVRNLLNALERIDHNSQYVLFVSSENETEFASQSENWQKVVDAGEQLLQPEACGAGRRFISVCGSLMSPRRYSPVVRRDGVMREAGRRYDLDVLFFPMGGMPPCDLGCATVATVLDLQHESFSEYFANRVLADRARYYQPSFLAATRVIAISDSVKQTTIESYHLCPEKIDAVPLAAPPHYCPAADQMADSRILEKHELKTPFAFYPANTWPHKNHVRLVRAWATALRHGVGDLQLVLTGHDFGMDREIKATAEELGIQDSVRRIGYLPVEDLPALYRSALFLIFPSLYEGFGIPVLEAMQSGCPVATSRCCSLPEVAGDATMYFDAEDETAIADAIVRLGKDQELRSHLGQAGLEQARKFSYDKCAEQTLNVLQQAVRDYGPKRYRREADRVSVSRHNFVYSGSRLTFRCPGAREISITLRAGDRIPDECALGLRIQAGGTHGVTERVNRAAVTVTIPCQTDRDMVTLDFDVTYTYPWDRLRYRRELPYCRIERLTVGRQDRGEFVVV